jgi:hypothetical protein
LLSRDRIICKLSPGGFLSDKPPALRFSARLNQDGSKVEFTKT